jgi:hypothetical protein
LHAYDRRSISPVTRARRIVHRICDFWVPAESDRTLDPVEERGVLPSFEAGLETVLFEGAWCRWRMDIVF